MKSSLSKLFSSPLFRIGLPITISLVSLYLGLKNVSLEDVGDALSRADVRFIAFALASVTVNTLVKAARWKVLMKPRGYQVSFFQALKSLLVGHTLNMLYPGRIGDLNRAYVVGGLGPGRVFVLGTVVVEKILDMLSYAFLFLFLLLLIPLPTWVNDSAYTFASIAIIVSLAVLIITYQREVVTKIVERVTSRFPKRIKTYTNNRFRSGIASLDVLQSNPDLLKLGILSAVVWGTAVLNNQLTLLALDIHLPLTASILILVALQVGITIPSVPGRFGVFQYICVLALGVYEIDQATAFSYGILLHAIVILLPALVGLLIFAMPGYSKDRIDFRSPTSLDTSKVVSDSLHSTAGQVERSEEN